MPLTITVAELAAAIRLTADASTPPSEPQLSILHRQLRVAESEIDGYALSAPEGTKDEAAIRYVGYLYDAPMTALNNAPYVNAFSFSGAKALLAPWHVLGSVAVTASTPEAPIPGEVTPETGINPSHPVHTGTHFRYAGWSDDGVISQAELDAAAQFTGDVLTVPNRATNGYFFFGVDEDPGYPDSILLDGNPTNQITNFIEQTARLTREGNTVIIGISTADLSAALSGRTWTLGYVSP